jgi:hypothetical protein
MPQLFVKVELMGTPGEGDYKKLREYMRSKNWCSAISGANLPHATYQTALPPGMYDLMEMARSFKVEIEKTTQVKALVLVIRSADWAQSAA